MNPRTCLFLLSLMFALAAPLLPKPRVPATSSGFPGWPREFEGVPLHTMPATAQDAWFTRDFPGKVARFAARDRQVVLRWVNSPTRRLHPAAHCFTGAGYQLTPRPMRADADGALMSCFTARKDGDALRVCEQLRDGAGRTWPDISSWYWHAVTAPSGSSWWSYVIVEHEPPANGV
jgi:hypothetical protein